MRAKGGKRLARDLRRLASAPGGLAPNMHRDPCANYLPSFQISAASLQSFPTFSQTTTYFPLTSCGVGPLVFRLKVPISRAAEGPSGLTSRVVSFGSLTCSAMPFHIAPMAVPPCTIAAPGGNAVASVVESDAT